MQRQVRCVVVRRRLGGVWAVIALAAAATTAGGCADPCSSSDDATVSIGTLSGAATFEPLAAGDEAFLTFAPQGGMGVATALQVAGMESHPDFAILAKDIFLTVRVVAATAQGGRDVLGDFPLRESVRCANEDGGIAANIVFGLDFERFGFGPDPSNPDDPLTALDGQSVTLEVDAEDVNGSTASSSAEVVLRVPQ